MILDFENEKKSELFVFIVIGHVLKIEMLCGKRISYSQTSIGDNTATVVTGC